MPNIDSFVMPNGDTRYYGYYEPDPATPSPLPLLIALHGGGGDIVRFASQLDFPPPAPGLPYLTVFAQGFGPQPPNARGVWNSGHSKTGLLHARDDVAFIDALITEVESRAATAGITIDLNRIYAVGFSNGGMMAYRLAAELSSRFAAVAIMAGSIGGDPDPGDPMLPVHVNDPALHSVDPVAILHIHGLADTNVSFYGGPSQNPSQTRCDVPAWQAIRFWVQHNGCQAVPNSSTHTYGVLQAWQGGANGMEVHLVTSPGLGHRIPPDALDEIASFLLAFQK